MLQDILWCALPFGERKGDFCDLFIYSIQKSPQACNMAEHTRRASLREEALVSLHVSAAVLHTPGMCLYVYLSHKLQLVHMLRLNTGRLGSQACCPESNFTWIPRFQFSHLASTVNPFTHLHHLASPNIRGRFS